eukprot:2618110-Lingulodinium_polyedra.AAC.1
MRHDWMLHGFDPNECNNALQLLAGAKASHASICFGGEHIRMKQEAQTNNSSKLFRLEMVPDA